MFGWLRRTFRPPPTEQQLRMARILASYPLYAPPEFNPDSTPESIRAASAQYEEYFLGSRQARLEALRTFLGNFDVSLDTDDVGLMAVSTWLPQWADLLIDDFDYRTVWYANLRLEVPWTGPQHGLNVLFDLGIYYAECLWARRTKLEWTVMRYRDANGDNAALHSIKGLPGGKPFDPIDFMHHQWWSICQAKIDKRRRSPLGDDPMILRSDTFYRHVLSNAPPGRRRIKTGRPAVSMR